MDDTEVEAEIQRALDALVLGEDEVDGTSSQEEDGLGGGTIKEEDIELTNEMPACLSQFILRVQNRADNVQQELLECDALLASVVGVNEEKREDYFYQSSELKEYAFQIGEDPEELRDRVIQELAADDDDGCKTRPGVRSGVNILSLQGPLFEKENRALEDGVSLEEVQRLQDAAEKRVREFEEHFDSSLHRLEEGYQEGQRLSVRRERLAEKGRAERIKQNNQEQHSLSQERMLHQAKFQEELDRRNQEMEQMLAQCQNDIKEMDERTKREKLAFLQQRLEYQKTLSERMDSSATKIQAVYRSYRARKPYIKKLRLVRENVRKKLADKRQMEIAAERKLLEQQRKRERDERRKREEEDRRRQEEERLRKEATALEEQQRALEQKRERERLEAEERAHAEAAERERKRLEEDRKEREQQEMEEQTNLILAKILREKKEVEEKGKAMNSGEGRGDMNINVDMNIHDDKKSIKREEGIRQEGGYESVNVCHSEKMESGDGRIGNEGLIGVENGNCQFSEDGNPSDGMNIHDGFETHKKDQDEIQSTEQAPGKVRNGVHETRNVGESKDTGVQPAVTVAIVTDEYMNTNEDIQGEKSGDGSPNSEGMTDNEAPIFGSPGNSQCKASEAVLLKNKTSFVTIAGNETRPANSLNAEQGSEGGLQHSEGDGISESKAFDLGNLDISQTVLATDVENTGGAGPANSQNTGQVSEDSLPYLEGVAENEALILGNPDDSQTGVSETVLANGKPLATNRENAGGARSANIPNTGQDLPCLEGVAENKALILGNLDDLQTGASKPVQADRQTLDVIKGNGLLESCAKDIACSLGHLVKKGDALHQTMVTSDASSCKEPTVEIAKQDGEGQSSKSFVIENEDLIKQGDRTGQTMLPDAYERARLEWMKTSTSFSKCLIHAKDNLRSLEKRKRRYLRRPSALKKMAAVTEEKLLEASPAATKNLAEVMTLKLSDLSGCSLTTLTNCPRLKALSCHRSQLQGLEGLEKSTEVTYIDFKGNGISFVNCRDLTHLTYLDLSENNLSTIHGLEGCSSLRWLNLSKNKITRLSGIECLIALFYLDVSLNQLINVQGLSSLVHLTSLNLADNHLSGVLGLESCPLLQRLNLSGNSISKPPELSNHVLLTELHLDNNSLVTMETIRTAWLPRLQTLSLAQSSLSAVPILELAPSLKKLDIRNNYITDTSSLKDGLSSVPYLEELLVDGNPVTEDSDYRDEILRLVPTLAVLDQDRLPSTAPPRTLSHFEVMCQSQIEVSEALEERHSMVLGNIKEDGTDLANLPTVWMRFLELSQKMTIDHRYMHEYGDLSPVRYSAEDLSKLLPDIDDSPGNGETSKHLGELPQSHEVGRMKDRESFNHRTVESCDKLEGAVGKQEIVRPLTITTSDSSGFYHETVRSKVLGPSERTQGGIRKDCSERAFATSVSGGNGSENVTIKIPKLADVNSNTKIYHKDDKSNSGLEQESGINIKRSVGYDPSDVAAIKIQSAWRGFQVRREIALHSKRYLAAVTIQALWRGHMVRQRYRKARAALLNVESEEGEELCDDVDLEFLDFNEESLDNDWFPSGRPDIPSSHPVLPGSDPSSPHRPVSSVDLLPTTSTDKMVPHPPRQAWRSSPQETLCGKPPLPPVTPPSSRGGSSMTTTARTVRSRKEQQLSEEWGFKDNVTAELMMKRARKMNRSSKNKSLDPIQKLRMLKKVQDSHTTRPVHPQTKRGIQRKEYFKAKEEIKNARVSEVNDRTYQWVHTQASHQDQPPPYHDTHHTMKGRHSTSEPNLPRLSPDVLQGRVQLTASPSLELESVDGLSVHGGVMRGRSNSLTSHEGNQHQLPSLKTNSAPTDHIRQRQARKASAESNNWGKSYKNR